MLIIYRSLINLLLLISPLIILLRILKGKEDLSRFFEKYGFSTFEKKRKKLIWFHWSSVGEILSVIPIIEKIEIWGNLDKEKKIHLIANYINIKEDNDLIVNYFDKYREFIIKNTLKYFTKDIIEFKGVIHFDTSMPNGNPRKLLDSSKINDIGWTSKTSLEEGISKTYKWYLENI